MTGPEGRIDPDSGTELASQDRLRELYRASEMSSLPTEPVSVPDLTRDGLEIEGLLGKGGMGTVYRARQQRPARTVAVKVLSGGGLRDAELRQRFEREIHALSSLASPYIVPIYGLAREDRASPLELSITWCRIVLQFEWMLRFFLNLVNADRVFFCSLHLLNFIPFCLRVTLCLHLVAYWVGNSVFLY